jgi:putative transcriptional regulator
VEFIFSQTAPVVCLPCKQTDFTKRIIALFRVLLYRVSSKKWLKIENTKSNQLEQEFSFSFDRYTKSIANGFLPVLLLTAKLFSRNEETGMTVSYKKLWKLLIDKDMKKKDLEKAAGISNYVISKMNKGENITVDIVGKICSALDCTPNDIMEFYDDSK